MQLSTQRNSSRPRPSIFFYWFFQYLPIVDNKQKSIMTHSLLLTWAKASRYSNVSSGTGSSRRNCFSSVAASCGCTFFSVSLPCLYRDSSSCLNAWPAQISTFSHVDQNIRQKTSAKWWIHGFFSVPAKRLAGKNLSNMTYLMSSGT